MARSASAPASRAKSSSGGPPEDDFPGGMNISDDDIPF
jgi:hypothetical protein